MANEPHNNQKTESTTYLPIGMCIGLSLGMALGAAMGSIGVGMCMGLGIGVGIGALVDANMRKKKNVPSDTDEKAE
jgi:uncharacterized transporter YbjL